MSKHLIVVACFCSLGGLVAPVHAGVWENRQVVFDFTDPDISDSVSWTDNQAITATKEGLGFDGRENTSRDVRIEFKEPVAVGWSWRPTTSVMIRVESQPAGKFRFGPNSIIYPSTAGVFYACYSPDRKNWTTWQPLSLREPRQRDKPRLVFHGQLRVPGKVREPYIAFLLKHDNKKRYLGDIDEEAAVKALLQLQPKYFEQRKPFIGYVNFLYETQIRGNQRLRKLNLELSYGRGGMAPTPEGHQESDAWRLGIQPNKSAPVTDRP